jgi:predicted aspartyl protease
MTPLHRLPAFVFACTLLACATRAMAAEAAACTPTEVASVPIRYVGSGLAPAIDGAINGKPATMLVDTGAFMIHLTMNGANRHRLALRTTQRRVNGIGGSSGVYVAEVRDFAVGPARASRRQELDVIAESGGNSETTAAFDAIVGAPFLLQMDLEFDLGAKRMRFLQARDCGQTPLAPWQEATFAVPFEGGTERNPKPHFTVLVNGRALDAIVDTGAFRTVMSRAAAQRAGVDVGAPGAGTEVRRLGEAVGVGPERAPHWSATFKTFTIGSETIRDAELAIIDARGDMDTDLLLGRDYLRTHRVLFAMGQRKLYIAAPGGAAFGPADGLVPLLRAEAEQGNPDLQYALSQMYRDGRGVARDPALARAWLDKAAAGGEPHAGLQVGRRLVRAGQLDDGIRAMRAALDQLPADRTGPLWLYLARVRNGVPGLGKRELEDSLALQAREDWPRPIADFYLGTLDEAGLRAAAGREAPAARSRGCQAETYIAEWHAAHGDQARAAAIKASARTHCSTPASAATNQDTST